MATATKDVEKTDAAESAVKTAAEKPKEKASTGKRGRAAKASYPIPDGQKLDKVPTDFNGDKYNLIPESSFKSLVLHRQFLLSIAEQRVVSLKEEIEQLSAVDEDLQSDMSDFTGGISKACSGLKTIRNACRAKLSAAKESGDKEAIAEAEEKLAKAEKELKRRVQMAIDLMSD